MRKVALIGGPLAGEVLESDRPRIMVPVLNDRAVCMPQLPPPLLKGFATYEVKRVRLGAMSWFVAKIEGDDTPVSPLAIFAGARPSAYVFG